MKIKTIIFDLDGTLLDTLRDLQESVNHTLTHYQYPPRTLDEVRRFVGNGVRVLLTRAFPAGTSEERIEEALVIFRNHYSVHMYDHTRLYEGIDAMLSELSKAGYRLAIVSNKMDSAVKDLDQKFFNGMIELAIGAPKEHKKPDPYAVLKVMEALSCTPEECLYVGDSEVDIETAHNASLPCVGVSWGFRGHEFLKEHEAHFIIDHPSELISLLNQN
ncbi:MAG: HAD-IIIA family hydrolase [Lachnospiraceae bacterium]|nr:HAD-IIIA family hydrolase [Lachnospiraceae bacterium]